MAALRERRAAMVRTHLSDPGLTLRVYAHMLPCSHERARQAIDNRIKLRLAA